MPNQEMLTAVDLFSGAGGMSLGLGRAGFKIVLAADYWTPACASYRRNFPDHRFVQADLGKMEPSSLAEHGVGPGSVDLVAGGPPCQGFSIQRIGPDSDPRNHLVLRFGEYVEWLRPRMFIMENVPGLVGKRGRELAAHFESRMVAAGYGVTSAVLDAAAYGVPQRRRRVVFAGWRLEDGVPPFSLPGATLRESDYRTVSDAIGDLPSPPMDYSPHPSDPLHRRMKISTLNEQRLRLIPPGGGFEDLPINLRVDCHKAGAERIGHRYVYGRLHPDEPAATITARFDSFTRGQFAHPSEHRNISLREGARLQTFPDGFEFTGTQEEIAAQIGNAVPPLFAEQLGSAVVKHLLASSKRASPPNDAQLPLFRSGERSVGDGVDAR
jgi:DNA (cytosine-5)-methyltransferase 1